MMTLFRSTTTIGVASAMVASTAFTLNDVGIKFPVRAFVTNRAHPTCTVLEIQALDRIGLLHDLFQAVNSVGLTTMHARICTEKGAAMDSLYVVDADGTKLTDEARSEELRNRIEEIAAAGESD